MNYEPLVSLIVGRVMLCVGGLALVAFLTALAFDFVWRQVNAQRAFCEFVCFRRIVASRQHRLRCLRDAAKEVLVIRLKEKY